MLSLGRSMTRTSPSLSSFVQTSWGREKALFEALNPVEPYERPPCLLSCQTSPSSFSSPSAPSFGSPPSPPLLLSLPAMQAIHATDLSLRKSASLRHGAKRSRDDDGLGSVVSRLSSIVSVWRMFCQRSKDRVRERCRKLAPRTSSTDEGQRTMLFPYIFTVTDQTGGSQHLIDPPSAHTVPRSFPRCSERVNQDLLSA
ncbi:hypothetical protein AAT19DRAFT_9399 [Rhodotorula toruloides]|uniref:Uncharacterized protein n=1 Tax=Rhodotorula toruloides TaxID=5286 RepID=A0A2T0A240_RHOTO|nr:hypothetical protein AAT19DRAFT_9399 [Rhodotorula toruloides]